MAGSKGFGWDFKAGVGLSRLGWGLRGGMDGWCVIGDRVGMSCFRYTMAMSKRYTRSIPLVPPGL